MSDLKKAFSNLRATAKQAFGPGRDPVAERNAARWNALHPMQTDSSGNHPIAPEQPVMQHDLSQMHIQPYQPQVGRADKHASNIVSRPGTKNGS